MAKNVIDQYKEIYQSLKNKVYQPVYLFQGEESFFIDKLVELIEEDVLSEAEKEFNLDIFYGKDIEINQLISAAKRYPMAANHHVVIVKEAQHLKQMDKLSSYIENPLTSTLLVLVHKHNTLDGRKTISKTLKKKGLIFTSKKLYENQIPDWVSTYLSNRGFTITPKASIILTEYVGNDLSKISNELDKLIINLEKGTKINDHHIEQNIGISKDYNIFELQNAIGSKDIARAYKIADYFGNNVKSFPLLRITSNLYYYFTKLMLIHKSRSQNPGELASIIGLHPFLAKEYIAAARNYSFGKIAAIIHDIKEYDLKSKGINNASTGDGELLRELVFRILN
ncbi:MAG: DNA polymerase III subunit delta [Bacteroidales bacterium]